MAGTLVISTLSDGTNSTSSTNCIQGSAKAWVNYNGSTQTIAASFNVSSVTYVGAGSYTVNYTTALSSNACPVVCATDDSATNRASNVRGTNSAGNTTTACQVSIWQSGGGGVNSTGVYVAVFR